MRASAVAGIIFANTNDSLLKKLTADRSMAAVPFAARYRLIDFPLSGFVNAGISSIGVITKENYRSLMDHIGSGVSWDLDRKNGGLFLLPPYVTSEAKRYNGTVDALHGAMDYIERCNAEYLVLCNGDLIANMDIRGAVQAHLQTRADVTLLTHYGIPPAHHDEMLFPVIGENGRISKIEVGNGGDGKTDYVIGAAVIGRKILLDTVRRAFREGQVGFLTDVVARMPETHAIYAYEHRGFVAVLGSTDDYYQANMAMLDAGVRAELFDRERPVFTKTRDDMPTRYGIRSSVSNCLIADGCVIAGTVKNSIVSRGVTVEKGAVVENSILMQGTTVKANAVLQYVITDKNASIGENMMLKGAKDARLFVEKNQML